MASFNELFSELVGTITPLSALHARQLVNEAWEEIRDRRRWSFLVSTGELLAPLVISAGTASVTQYSTSVIVSTAAAVAINAAVAAGGIPVADATLGKGRSFRAGQSGGTIYQITGWDGTNTLTLATSFKEPTQAGIPYRIYRLYYYPPTSDFLMYETVVNIAAGYGLRGPRLYTTQAQLNARDPQRGATGDAYRMAEYSVAADGIPVKELWPGPTNARVYNCIYRKRGTDFAEADSLPLTFPSVALRALSKQKAGEWALANVGTYPTLAQTNWPIYIGTQEKTYNRSIQAAVRQDDEIAPLLATTQGQVAWAGEFPLGGEFAQSHSLSGLF